FAGAHLGDAAVVEREAADELNVEVPHLERALRGFADHGKGFGREIVQRLAPGQALAELLGLGAQRFVAEGLQGFLEARRPAHRPLVTTDDAIVAAAEEPRQEIEHLSILARYFRPENCNAVSDLGLRTARPGRYSTDRPASTVLVSTGRPVPGQWGRGVRPQG